MGRGFLAGLFWGFVVGAGMLLVSSQALDRQELSLPQPEASTVEVPGGSEFDQARVETDPVLPESDSRPEGDTTGLAAVPDDAVETPPAFDTTALEVPTPSVGEAGELSEAPATSDAPRRPRSRSHRTACRQHLRSCRAGKTPEQRPKQVARRFNPKPRFRKKPEMPKPHPSKTRKCRTPILRFSRRQRPTKAPAPKPVTHPQ